MTLFGILWNEMQQKGEAPKESLFSCFHSQQWHVAQEVCRERVKVIRSAFAERQADRTEGGR